MSFDDSGFTSAKLDTSEDSGFDAGRYAFFGNFGDDVGALDDTAPLEGALEEGLEAPPEEELAAPYEMLDADEDLGYASMFAAALGKGKEPSLRSPTATDAAGSLELSEPTPPPPPKPKLGSIALGGLLAASTPTESAFSGMPSSSPSSFGGFGAPQHPNNPLGLPFGLVTTKSQQQQPSVPPKALTSEELEAQLRGAAAPAPPQGAGESSAMGTTSMYAGFSQQQEPQQQSAPLYMPPGYNGPPSQAPPGMSSFFPPAQPPPTMQTHPGVFTPEMIMQQQLNQQQQQQQRHGPARPPGPPSNFMPPGMMPPPPPSGASGMLPFGHPPSVLHPGPPLPPPPQQHHAPGAAHHPGMMMMMPPPHHHHRPHAPRPPPPALGAGPPRPQQPGFYGHGGPRPPMGGGGGRPSGHPHPTLAQRLRALNLADRPDFARGPTLRRRIHSSQYMDSEEIESILSMQWRSLYQGNPYIEDHYYQAFVFKHYGRRNRRTFAPESVRELAPTEKMAPDQVAFVKLEGLGRVAFSNIRRPRPLMDVSPEDLRAAAAAALQEADAQDTASHGNGTTPAADAAASVHPGSGSGAQPTRRLGQEPMLAARIMLEDCMALILDVQDIDRIFVAGTGGRIENEAALLQRRTLLMDGLAASLRLPEHAVASARKDAGAPSDGVFLRLLTLPKGKTLAARALQQLYPPSEIMDRSGTSNMEPNLRILWAVLRNARALFGGAPMPAVAGGKAAIEAALGTASKVAEAASDVIKRLHSPQAVCDALSAVTHGDLIPSSEALENDPELVLLPLFAPGDSSSETRYRWLSDVLRALLQRGAEFELSSGAKNNVQGGEQAVESWLEQFPKLYGVVSGHVLALSGAAVAAKEEGDRDGVEELKRMVPVGLVRSFLPHCGKEQGDELRSALTSMGL